MMRKRCKMLLDDLKGEKKYWNSDRKHQIELTGKFTLE
jgi:hypothetical protein